MARATNKLTAPEVRALKKPGRHSDGGGLYLVVDEGGAKRWVFLFRWQGRRLEMGLGGFLGTTVAVAREKAKAAREAMAAGSNPIDARRALAAIPTFGEMADEVTAIKAASFRRAKSVWNWDRSLKVFAESLRPVRVDLVDTDKVLKALKPIWATTPESAQKARSCIEAVLDAAKAKGYRTGENPARWRGQLDHLLPKRRKLTRGHQRAMPFGDVPAFTALLRDRVAMSARALEFLILTAARSGEVLGATWSEIDLASQTWIIPADRMKGGREHRVPLSARAVAILDEVVRGSNGAPEDFVFPGQRRRGSVKRRGLSGNGLPALLKRMGVDVTAHGFRSSFRDWAGEASTFPREVAEAALAHLVGDETERAYRRGDALEKRRKLMDAWAGFCAQRSGGPKVVPLSRIANAH